MKHLTIILLLFFPFTIGFTQNTNNGTETPYVEVTGTAEKEVIPDEIYLRINLKERLKGKTVITVEKQELDLKAAINRLGISLDNLTLADASAGYIKIRWKKKGVISQKDYQLKLGTAEEASNVFEALDELKIQDASIHKVDHSKMDSLHKVMRIEATKAAKEKAGYLLEALDQTLGKPLVVREVGGNHYRANTIVNFEGIAIESKGTGEYSEQVLKHDIQFRKINLRASVYVKFAIN